MGYRQPKVPEYREQDTKVWIRELILFLRDFSLDAWSANGRRKKEIEALQRRVSALEEKKT